MQFIAHRINTSAELEKLSPDYGLEIDIRDFADDLIVHHEPFLVGERFSEFLAGYRHRTLILNIKSEGIELRVQKLLKQYQITDYFFLDSSFPMLVKLANQGEHKLAIRISEYESLTTAINMRGLAQWVWVDCFTKMPLAESDYRLLKDLGYQVCLVSPALLGRFTELNSFARELQQKNIRPDAICCKVQNASFWQGLF